MTDQAGAGGGAGSPDGGAGRQEEQQQRQRTADDDDDVRIRRVADIVTSSPFPQVVIGSGTLTGATLGVLTSAHPALFAALTGLQWSLLSSTFLFTRTAYLHRGVIFSSPFSSPSSPSPSPSTSTHPSTYPSASPTQHSTAQQMHPPPKTSTAEAAKASSLAGAAAGGLTAASTRGPRNVLPGMLVFGALGLVGQSVVDFRRSGRGTTSSSTAPTTNNTTSNTTTTTTTTNNTTNNTTSSNRTTTTTTPPSTTNGTTATPGTTATKGTDSTTNKERNILQQIADSRWTPGLRTLSDGEYVAMMEEKMLRLDAEIAIVDERIARVKVKGGGERGVERGVEKKGGEDKK
ncbi:hypothetical protein EJ05DRAFT_481655 [Pseudovirgaria hyperparasitica]|uniref:Uncharacterized protein n=1 Tax=Pseudovirgaria hyperparasitica TaxID=470096 RepID=A0A6A6WKR2_9PEZI|nr:uncharacterized protein EJ05DRAFT_481655 [Pseudovirgaria hyperparasitica]KAF2762768.1 hypothetical protein EJ05DRAFT_481655 [Pseudovirgaria hyperparasitica]